MVLPNRQHGEFLGRDRGMGFIEHGLRGESLRVRGESQLGARQDRHTVQHARLRRSRQSGGGWQHRWQLRERFCDAHE